MSLGELWATLDAEGFGRIVGLSLGVSLAAAALASVLGSALGAALCVYRVPGRRVLVVAINALLGLPPVVVGLVLYLLLSRSGALGGLGLLFTPSAMVLAQTVLALPIVAALVHAGTTDLWAEYGGPLQVDGATRLRAMGAYTISDRGTWLSFGNKGDLAVLVEGDPRLLNRYDVILLDPKKHPEAKQQPAHRLAAWLVSPAGQAAIGGYRVNGKQLFHPSAAAPK